MLAPRKSRRTGALRQIVVLTMLVVGSAFGAEAEAGILFYDAERFEQEALSSVAPPNLMGEASDAEFRDGLGQRSTDGMAGCSARGPELEVVADQLRQPAALSADLQFRLLLSRSVICTPEVTLGIFRPPECNVLLDFLRY